MAKFANIWTNQDGYILSFSSLSQLNIYPPMISPSSNSSNAYKLNIPTSIPTWYTANSVELNI